ncbi:hypothetical protein J6590_056593 [Homalodisca vitripennis]|nr:hypothetical protein J6590_056593 [Homalodisca vitripennis]
MWSFIRAETVQCSVPQQSHSESGPRRIDSDMKTSTLEAWLLPRFNQSSIDAFVLTFTPRCEFINTKYTPPCRISTTEITCCKFILDQSIG